jgi:hypothetical protein
MKLLKTRIYYYCLPNKIKKQISSYLCEVVEPDTNGMVVFRDPNGDYFSTKKENINLTVFLGSVDASYSIVFENIGEHLNIEEAEKEIQADTALFFKNLIEIATKEA